MMRESTPACRFVILWLCASLAGCGIAEVKQAQDQAVAKTQAHFDSAPQSRAAFRSHEGAWLLGEKVRAEQDQPQLYERQVSYRDADGHASTLAEVVDWLARTYRVRTLVDASVYASAGAGVSQGGASNAAGTSRLTLPAGLATSLSAPGTPGAAAGAQSAAGGPLTPTLPLVYVGNLKGFLPVLEQRYGVYAQYRDGAITFFKTETRTFTLPDLADVSSMSGVISTDSAGGAGGGGASGAGGGGGKSAGGAGNGGQSSSMSVQSNPWASLQKTADAIAGSGAQVVADANLGTLTVTGTPAQCDRIEAFVRNLTTLFGKQVAIDVKIYEVQMSQEDNYALTLGLSYKSGSGHTGATFTSASAPTLTSSASPLSLGATIVGGSLDGSKAAVQALSTLGNVTQIYSRSGVTRNGKVLGLQAATLQDYVPSTQTTLSSNVGSSTSIQTATNISGFTSSFRTKVVNGQILLAFDMTISELQPLQTFTVGSSSGSSSVQLRTMPLARFEQSVGLKSGETLVLTGMRQQTTSKTNNGVGAPWMSLLGGGVDAQLRDTMIAVVITARLL